ncbi:sulfite exporter TauE/SafE family protein [Gallaecimonas kandeliae]|uniref:sulfite exporter TauE/SafE family protein n=1 Tax=Gallaecimonas kandeliae TaxID=3029055 RepID=UPI0026497CD0|nr:sulfite exporter TauE/SafE family protein [Gallaecimonas kandeliae]WKE64977.1 sulfite exporter TauE/SafE family protein [Gallaecimonas kandeliae]
MLLVIGICLVVGAFAGLLSGLLGIGGGLVIVPTLAWLLPKMGIHHELVMPMALATSLATICVTGASSVRAHHSRGSVPWQQARWLVAGMILGGLLGAQLAALMSGLWLKRLFATFLFFSAWRMLAQKGRAQGDGQLRISAPALGGINVALGSLASMLGIGGGALVVPMLSFAGMAMTQAVASAATCTLAVAVSGTLSYAVSGLHQQGLPAGSLGFLYLPALLALLPGAFFMAPQGVKLLHKVPAHKIKMGFAVLLVLVGLDMLFN